MTSTARISPATQGDSSSTESDADRAVASLRAAGLPAPEDFAVLRRVMGPALAAVASTREDAAVQAGAA